MCATVAGARGVWRAGAHHDRLADVGEAIITIRSVEVGDVTRMPDARYRMGDPVWNRGAAVTAGHPLSPRGAAGGGALRFLASN